MASRFSIEIDPDSGFCHGVVRAVDKAEEFLSQEGSLYSLGAMVHNTAEIARLGAEGLETIDLEQMKRLPAGSTVLIRAHGEPPHTYALARSLGIRLIDCTCPVVLGLQKDIAAAYASARESGGQVVIFGKKGHAEVNGLVGQTGGEAIVIESADEISRIDFGRHIELFSQTTRDKGEYENLQRAIRDRGGDVTVHDTICRQVQNRLRHLSQFAASFDVILFASGRESSNGHVLFELCRSHNSAAHWVEGPASIHPEWLAGARSVGICGATSTPRWQLEEVAAALENL